MRKKLFFGRTPPDRAIRARSALKDRAETLSARVRRVKPLHAVFDWNPQVDDEFAGLLFHRRPLPPLRLADGTCPYWGGAGMDPNDYNGTLPLDGPADSRIVTLWRECLARRPARANFQFALRAPEMVTDVIGYLELYAREGSLEIEARFQYWERESEPEGIARFVAAMGLAGYAGADDPRPKGALMPGESRRIEVPGLPPDPGLPTLLTGGLERLGWVEAPIIQSMDFLIVDRAEGYSAMRPRLNEIARDWDSMIHGTYRRGFDPFLTPPFPPPGEEYRFPVADYIKPGEWFDAPTIQVDMVHSAQGSFLEFLSADSEATLRRYADLADVEESELEIWSGPAEDRWGTS